jgi:hypothetical protein
MKRILVIPFLGLLVIHFPAGCGKSDTETPGNFREISSIGADAVYRAEGNVYGRAEMKASEFVFGDRSNEPDMERFRAFTEATGLAEKDLLEVVMCGSVTNLNMDDLSALTDVESLPLNIAFSLARPVSYDQYKAGVQALEDDPDGQYIDEELAGSKVLKRISSDDTKPVTFGALARDGKTVYIAFNRHELSRTLSIEKSGRAEIVSKPLQAAFARLTDRAPMRVAIIIPEQIRAAIREQINEAKKEAGLLGGMLFSAFEPFVNLQSIGIATHDSTNLVLDVLGDMKDPENATDGKKGVAVIVASYQGMLMSRPDAPSINLETAVQSEVKGKFLELKINLPKDTVEAITP